MPREIARIPHSSGWVIVSLDCKHITLQVVNDRGVPTAGSANLLADRAETLETAVRAGRRELDR